MNDAWRGFLGTDWKDEINVSSFIKNNYMPYEGTAQFLSTASERTLALWSKCSALIEKERLNNGVLDIDASRASSILAYGPGYIDKDSEIIVGLQTEAPLTRPVHCLGGIRMAEQACKAYGYELNPTVSKHFRTDRRTHNDAVFGAYTAEMKKARHIGLLTGLPDAYGRGRIIGDYRRVSLYGTTRLITIRKAELETLLPIDEEHLKLRDEVAQQIDALKALEAMGDSYGINLREPARNAREAAQNLYLAYLASLKEQNGAAMSLGRVTTFLDIYFQRDMVEGRLDEKGCQEIIDQLVIKLRLARMARTPEYNALFAGDPLWITESVGGMTTEGRPLVTKTSFRLLQTLRNLGPAPEPNITILWSTNLPTGFKEFCAEISLETSSIQYENDDMMRSLYGDDYGIACCVSAMELGKTMQYFGARCNLPKLLLLAINGGKDDITGEAIGPQLPPLKGQLSFDLVWDRFCRVLDWFVPLYADTMNLIHYMHDRYCYESLQMSLMDVAVRRNMAFGIAGLSIVADSLSSIKYGSVRSVVGARDTADAFITDTDFPCFGNDDDRVDLLATGVVQEFWNRVSALSLYRGAHPTISILTITSNVVYGKHTGATPDGRLEGEPFAPGANPLHGRDKSGLLASLNSVAKIPYEICQDGISYTCSLAPAMLGRDNDARRLHLAAILDGFFSQGGHHINVNAIDKRILMDAMDHPDKYPNLTLRVSGYAVHFHKLSKEQQQEVIKRTYFTEEIA